MSLDNWLRIGHLVNHKPSVPEVRNLLRVVDRELNDASAAGLSDDGCFVHSYDAALLLCKLALHASGFELKKQSKGHHALWINSLKFTLGQGQEATLVHLSKASTLRHATVYDYSGIVEKSDAQELFVAAKQLRDDVLNWLRLQHADLVSQEH